MRGALRHPAQRCATRTPAAPLLLVMVVVVVHLQTPPPMYDSTRGTGSGGHARSPEEQALKQRQRKGSGLAAAGDGAAADVAPRERQGDAGSLAHKGGGASEKTERGKTAGACLLGVRATPGSACRTLLPTPPSAHPPHLDWGGVGVPQRLAGLDQRAGKV